ncbi:MAG: hypothetical protein OXL37_07740 [Chloroflexota bacterium]|nr:hypothetical protein [Chloroflexota bacterium]MDE2960312.1 hypothetical protein [Chloroflexota bacterium]
MTTINDISDLARILQERPEWLSAIRGLVLTEEVLRMPETMAELTKTVEELARQTAEQFRVVNERLGRLETDVGGLKSDMAEVKDDVGGLKSDVAELKAEQRRTNRRLDRVESQLGAVRGDVFEITAARKILPSVIQQMGLYHCDPIVGPGINLAQDRINDIRQAEQAGTVERNSDQEVGLADIVLYGRQSSDNEPIWVVIEASARIDEHDITRARHRADILAAVYRENSAAVVVGESIDDRDQARATDAGVSVITVRPRYRPTEGDD